MILAKIPVAQLAGGLIETVLIFLGGLYLLLIWPRQVQAKIQAGKLSEAEGKEKLRKLKPKLGYLLLAVAVCQLITQLMQWFS